jgi:protein gp37
MAEISHISWTDATFNPWWGCTKVSPGCDNCYAERDSIRYGHAIWGKDADRRFFSEAHWQNPVKWNKSAQNAGVRKRVFCASMADIMEDRRDLDPWRERLWRLIPDTPWLDWLLLSKRPQNYRRLMPSRVNEGGNVWLGTTLESPEYLWRVDALKECSAIVHFLSLEPLTACIPMIGDYLNDIEWVITGGESGGLKARPAEPDWFRQIRNAAVSRNIPFHFKQWGEYGADLVRIGRVKAGSELDGREWKEFPCVCVPDGGKEL